MLMHRYPLRRAALILATGISALMFFALSMLLTTAHFV